MIITLTTDFGLDDPYVGVMKGVLLGIAPQARLVDISHGIARHGVREAAFVLRSAVPHFPAGTVHLAVVDPGVGSGRRPIAAFDQDQCFVGPDNGLLSYCFGPDVIVRHITNRDYFRSPLSATFHGRDVFAPVAARLASGADLETVGPMVPDWVRLDESPSPSVLHVDRFGNVITSLRADEFSDGSFVHIAGCQVRLCCATYSEAPSGELFLIAGSSGYMEIAMREQSAARYLGVGAGTDLKVETVPEKQ